MHTPPVLRSLFNRPKNQNGFTLVELALVLGVFAIILGGVIVVFSGASRTQQINRLHQQIITTVVNMRHYVSHIDNDTINMATVDACSLNLLPADVTSTTAGCPANETYMGALNQPLVVCAAGGNFTTQCGKGGLSNQISIVAQNLTSSDCTTLLSKLVADTSSLGLTQYVINGTAFPTATANNLSLATITGNNACGNTGNAPTANGNVNLELDFSE